MVYCSCGKALDKVPGWLQAVSVEFVCNNCPNRKTKNIAFISLEPVAAPAIPEAVSDIPGLEETAAEEQA